MLTVTFLFVSVISTLDSCQAITLVRYTSVLSYWILFIFYSDLTFFYSVSVISSNPIRNTSLQVSPCHTWFNYIPSLLPRGNKPKLCDKHPNLSDAVIFISVPSTINSVPSTTCDTAIPSLIYWALVEGLQDILHGPNLACYLFSQMRYYWNTATRTPLGL